MQITGITVEQFKAAVQTASARYGGNLRAVIGTGYSQTRFTARVLPVHTGYQLYGRGDDLAPGQRRSASVIGDQRRINAVCWHVYRDVLIEVFALNPAAKVRTAMAKYIGIEGFNREYPGTAHHNVGSMMYPVNMVELCDCNGPHVIPAVSQYLTPVTPAPTPPVEQEMLDWWADQSKRSLARS